MRELPYQTFPSINRVFIGADATITTRPDGAGGYPHWIVVKDSAQGPAVELLLTTDALVALRNHINTILDDPTEVAAWATRDLAGLALHEAMVVT